ncbi:TonB-dependent receptor [Hanstruepera flava]|uniref:TonB-dependent receptor n=1 Tax=Hanstruepera flava TaxID=2930218 RepID=UPI002027ED21|nr:TonB-dependent receptor [Hanstruepera flava]
MKHCIATIAVFIFGFSAIGQTCKLNLSGKIQDFHNGEPIVNATIYNKTTDSYTTSDLEGNFNINDLCKGIYQLSISHISCETKVVEIDLQDDLYKVVYLEHHVEELETVNVEGASVSKETDTGQETIIRKDYIDNNSSASLGDVIKQVSGVSSINTGNEIVKPVINGLHSSRIVILNNGVRLENQEWGIEHAPNIDINSANSISVIKGSSALAYSSDAIGGTIILEPKNIAIIDTLFGKTIMGYQSNGRGFNVNSSLAKNFDSGWYLNGNLGYKQNGDLKAPDYYLNNTGAQNLSGSFQSGYKSFEKGFEVYFSYIDSELGILSSSHIGNTADLVNAINSDEPLINEPFSYDINAPKQDVSHLLAKARGYMRFKSFGKVTFQYDYQNNHRYEFDKRVGNDRDKAAVDLRLQTHSVKGDVKVDKLGRYLINFGLSGRFQDNFANPDTGVRRLIPDYTKYDLGAYFILKANISEQFIGDFGVRYDLNHIDAYKYYYISRWEERGYDDDFSDIIIDEVGIQYLTNPVFTYNNFAVSTGLLFDINENHDIKFNYSLSSRPPNPSELFSDGLHHSAARIELGDLRLGKETSNRFGLSYLFNNNKFNITLDSYFNRVNDFIFLKPIGTEETNRGAFPVWEYTKTDANLIGLDANIDYYLNKAISFNVKTSYIYGQNLDEDLPLIDMPSFRLDTAVSYSKKEWNAFNASLNYVFVAEQNRYPDYNFETYIPTTDSYELVDISTPPPAYNLFNFQADMTFNVFKKSKLNVLARVDNIFNTSYREYLNRLRYFADDTGRNITIQLQLNY